MIRALIHASRVYTGVGFRKKDGRKISEDDCGIIEDGAVVYEVQRSGLREIPGKILWVGKTAALPKKYGRIQKRDLKKKSAITSGWVDCHTHLIFSGNRSAEFADRCTGLTYEQIASNGGGISATVDATRRASAQELFTLATQRIEDAHRLGVRVLEIKSGYGLSFESEIKSLELIQRAKKKFPDMSIHATFLGAHAFPKDQSRENYLDRLINQMLPAVARRKLADSCDIFIDRGYYSSEEGKKILSRARSLGLAVRVHADELTDTGSAELAVRVGALSADHLLKVSDVGIAQLAASNTVAVLLPGTAFFLKESYAPARKLIDAGAVVALATDFNPGTCMSQSLPFMMTLAALYMKMTRAEILSAVTYNAAKALGLHSKKGTIESGADAQLTVLPFETFEECYYRLGWLPS